MSAGRLRVGLLAGWRRLAADLAPAARSWEAGRAEGGWRRPEGGRSPPD